MDRPSGAIGRDVSADRAPASSPAYTPSYCVCGSHFDTGGLVYRSFMRINSQVDLLADDGYDEVYVPNGERMQVLFQDGSKVHLNSGSRIRYPKSLVFTNGRSIWKGKLGLRSRK